MLSSVETPKGESQNVSSKLNCAVFFPDSENSAGTTENVTFWGKHFGVETLENAGNGQSAAGDGNPETGKESKSLKKKDKDKHEKDEEEEIDKITKEHEFHPFFSTTYADGKFDDKFHECLNEAPGDSEDDKSNEQNGINHNNRDITYVGWPSLVAVPQLENEQHTQITKTFAYWLS